MYFLKLIEIVNKQIRTYGLLKLVIALYVLICCQVLCKADMTLKFERGGNDKSEVRRISVGRY